MRSPRSIRYPSLSIVVICLALIPGILHSEATSAINGSRHNPVLVATTDTAPEIDGQLNETEWKDATLVSDFVVRNPIEGSTPINKTHVFFMYTPQALYVGCIAYDANPSNIIASTMRRDDYSITGNDQFTVVIDSHNDDRNCYWFSTNPAAARVDARSFDDGIIFEGNWNGRWTCASGRRDSAWTIEMEIPFSTMQCESGDSVVMGINLARRLVRAGEISFAPFISRSHPNAGRTMSIARKFLFRGINVGRNYQVKPYVVADAERKRTVLPRTWNKSADMGVDFKTAVSQKLMAMVSINTDFAQAEVDERQVNLSRFRLFTPETRDFFLEETGLFTFGTPGTTQLYFSRRVGLGVDQNIGLVRQRNIGGAKISGRIGASEVGFMTAQTEKQGSVPSTNFMVARLKRGMKNGAYVGGMLASHSPTGASTTLGFGLDGIWYFRNRIGIQGYAAALSEPNSGNHFSDMAAASLAIFRGGDHSAFTIGFEDIGKEYDPPMGFVAERDISLLYASTNTLFMSKSYITEFKPSASGELVLRHGGGVERSSGEAVLHVTTRPDDDVYFKLGYSYENLRDAFTLPGNITISPGEYRMPYGAISVLSANGRKVKADLDLITGRYYGGMKRSASLRSELKFSKHLSLVPSYGRVWLDIGNASARIDVARLRSTLSFSPQAALVTITQYDSNTRILGFNTRFTYEFFEGTNVFVIYNQINDGDSFSGTFRKDATKERTFLTKLTYSLY